jgi:maspardin
MRKRLKWIIPLILVILIMGVYLYPVPRVSFEKNYAKSPPALALSLQRFRELHPAKSLKVNGVAWEYVACGKGQESILFLHGMTGAYDIWWQQMEALQDRYRVISVTYPAVDTLEQLRDGVMALMGAERVERVNIVGTSLGGYLAQFLVAKHPEHVLRAVFSNTFPPNNIIAEKNKAIGTVLPFLPEWLVMDVLRDSFAKSIYPASGNDDLTLAFLMEVGSGRMTRGQVVGRYRCVIEPFKAPDVAALKIPVMIIEAHNDPLVEKALREQLKTTYPSADVKTLTKGHFPYLNPANGFTEIITNFIGKPYAFEGFWPISTPSARGSPNLDLPVSDHIVLTQRARLFCESRRVTLTEANRLIITESI